MESKGPLRFFLAVLQLYRKIPGGGRLSISEFFGASGGSGRLANMREHLIGVPNLLEGERRWA
jgi:hypothetical protein